MRKSEFSCIGYILFVLLISSVCAFTLDESIEINNKNANDAGFMYSRTDSHGLNGMIAGAGNQAYHEILNTDPDNSILVSSYNLSGKRPNGESNDQAKTLKIGGEDGASDYIDSNAKSILQNRYFIRMDSFNGLSHFINLRTNGSIEANNAIVHNSGTKTVSTSYSIETDGGSVDEGITVLENGRHPKYAVMRNIVGAAKIKSNLSDTESSEVISDQALMLNKVEAVNMATQNGKISYLIPTNKVYIENERGDLSFNISNGSVKAAGVGLPNGGINVSVSEDPLANAIDQYDPVAQEAAEAVSIVSKSIDYKGVRFIIPLEPPEYESEYLSNETNSSNKTDLSPTNVPTETIAPQNGNEENANEFIESNQPIGTNASNLSAINSSEKADTLLKTMSANCDSPVAGVCPYAGSGQANTPSDLNSASPLKSPDESDLGVNQTPNASSILNDTMPEPGQNRTLVRGKTTFFMGDSDLPAPVPCVKQYVGLNPVPLGPPCVVKIGRGMGSVQY
jgi:hypothetical protein